MIQFGNQKSFAENKSRRAWKPNVHRVSLYSEALNGVYQFRITTHALRSVRKFGGLDNYLMNTKDSEIKYPVALRIKRCVQAIRATAVLPKDTAVPILDAPSEDIVNELNTVEQTITHEEPSIEKRAGLQQLL